MNDFAALGEKLFERAKAAGADDAEVLLQESRRFSTQVRQGAIETLSEATTRGIHLRVFVDQRVARAGSSDLRVETLEGMVERAIARARLTNQDPFAGLPEDFAAPQPERALALYDPGVEDLSTDQKIQMARETERVGLSLDSRVKNSGGAWFRTGVSRVWLGNTRGFRGEYKSSSCSLALHLLGQEEKGGQVSDYWYSATRHRDKLDPPERIARRTVERVSRHFGARKIPTQTVPVIFEPVLAAELLSDLFGALTGEAIYLRRSFLVGQLGQPVAAGSVTLIDDGLLPAALGSHPFDLEGVASQRTVVVEQGILRNYLCGTYAAKKLGRRSTGNGTGNGEAPTNFYLAAGPHSPEEILASVERGLFVTRLLGQGVNLVTGDYSRGAFGLWVEKGSFSYPVHEITISGNFKRMLAGVEMVGSDLEFRDQFASPTLRIADLTVAGT